MTKLFTCIMFIAGCWTGSTTRPQHPTDPVITSALVGSRPYEVAPAPDPAAFVEAAPQAIAQPIAVPPVASDQNQGASRPPSNGYLGGGGLYLPVDGGLTAASVFVGRRFEGAILEGRVGGRLAYGDSRYASAVALMAEAQLIRWFDTVGLGVSTAGGVVFASRKGTTGWDGTLPGALLGATARIRRGMIEPFAEIGILSAVGETYPAPYAILGAAGRL